MALWVDKHRPRVLDDLDYHQQQAQQLKNLAQQSDFPHLMFFGPSGAGKKTRILCLLRELYGEGVEHIKNETFQFTTASNKKMEILTVGSNYHLEINPSDAGIHDRIVVVELIKQIAQTRNLNQTGQREFKVIVLSEVDALTKDAQHALRRTMEKYMSTCRIVLSVNSTSRVIPAIRSRCLGIRVSAPTIDEISNILEKIGKKEHTVLPRELAERIANKSDRNLRRAILSFEATRAKQSPLTANQKIPDLERQVYLSETADQILSDQTPAKLEKIRERLYELLAQGIPADLIFKSLVQNLVKKCDMSLKAKTVELACLYEHRMHKGSKHIFHFEAFVANFMVIYKKFLNEMMDLDDA